jgi:hypothetical protein
MGSQGARFNTIRAVLLTARLINFLLLSQLSRDLDNGRNSDIHDGVNASRHSSSTEPGYVGVKHREGGDDRADQRSVFF